MIRLISLLKDGGIMMIPIFLASLVSVALILEIWWLLARSRTRFEELRDWQGPLPKGRRSDLFSSLLVWLHANPKATPDDKLRYADSILSAVERRVSWLNTIAAIAPLLGLLGTVSGMITNFATVAMVRPTDPLNQLARGISEALVATGGGLVVAILAAIGHHWLQNSLESFAAQIGGYLETHGLIKATSPERVEAPVVSA